VNARTVHAAYFTHSLGHKQMAMEGPVHGLMLRAYKGMGDGL
jgi:hypothetical protein